MAFHSLFVQNSILSAMAFFLLLFIVFHFFFVEIYRYPLYYLLGALSFLSVIWIAIGAHGNAQMIISVLVLHLSIFVL